MKNILLLLVSSILICSCTENTNGDRLYVKNVLELNKAIAKAIPGDEIVMANGVWPDVEINFYGLGTSDDPISLRAETPGQVFIEGNSFLHLGGKFLTVDGLYFRNGHSPKSAVIRYMIGTDSTANHSRVTNTVIEGFTKPNRLINDRWIEFYGKHNQLDHCYISGKSNDGETLRVFFTGNEHVNSHHQIVNNYFGPRPRKGGPRAETIRIGDSKTRFSPGYVNVSDNYFEACNGEVEIISDKTNFNSFKNNIFYKCEGSLVLRHGSYTHVDSNFFIGGDESDFYGGIRVVNAGHWITNNYFYKIKGAAFRSPLAIMNGIPMTPLNRYLQVSDVVIAHNTWVDCKSPWQIGVGQNLKSADVLPISEIRSAPPIRTTIANNIIYNTEFDTTAVINHSSMDGILFKNNLIDNNGVQYTAYDVLKNGSLEMKKINDWLYVPEDLNNESLDQVYKGYDFESIKKDIFGISREDKNSIGSTIGTSAAEEFSIDKATYGPNWFATIKQVPKSKEIIANSVKGDLIKKISNSSSGDIILLSDTLYTIDGTIKVDKNITIRPKNPDKKVKLVIRGDTISPLFEMHPKGHLKLQNLEIIGKNDRIAFAPLREGMASAYNLFIKNSTLENFDQILKAYKGSFADTLSFENTRFKNCKNGIILAAEDKGDYNAEMVLIDQCEFINVQKNVMNFFRGGYDESTIGGVLKITNSTFLSCGQAEKSKILIKTKGIINVDLTRNVFKNNPVELVALLWGEKNNHHKDNVVNNSGKIMVEDQQKLKILY